MPFLKLMNPHSTLVWPEPTVAALVLVTALSHLAWCQLGIVKYRYNHHLFRCVTTSAPCRTNRNMPFDIATTGENSRSGYSLKKINKKLKGKPTGIVLYRPLRH